MPIIRSAKKALRSSTRKRMQNTRRKETMKDEIKSVKKLVADKKIKEAQSELSKAYQAIDKAAKRGILTKNTAARRKSQLASVINKAAA